MVSTTHKLLASSYLGRRGYKLRGTAEERKEASESTIVEEKESERGIVRGQDLHGKQVKVLQEERESVRDRGRKGKINLEKRVVAIVVGSGDERWCRRK